MTLDVEHALRQPVVMREGAGSRDVDGAAT